MKRTRNVSLKDVVIPFFEGEAEKNLFGFLNNKFSNKRVSFKERRQNILDGVHDLADLKRKYGSKIKGLRQEYGNEMNNLRLLFIIDDDLKDSQRIKEFLEREGHLVQLCNPNIEGMILNIVGRPVKKMVGDEDYRKKCKNSFQIHFGCDAHELREVKLLEVFSSEAIIESHLPVLYLLFRE